MCTHTSCPTYQKRLLDIKSSHAHPWFHFPEPIKHCKPSLILNLKLSDIRRTATELTKSPQLSCVLFFRHSARPLAEQNVLEQRRRLRRPSSESGLRAPRTYSNVLAVVMILQAAQWNSVSPALWLFVRCSIGIEHPHNI